jgi:hypothetical protein
LNNIKRWVFSVGKRIVVALTSSFIFSLFFSLISNTPESQRSPDTYYFGLAIIYVTPIYFLIGIPISLVIDNWLKQKRNSYLLRLGLYSISSLIPSIIFIVLLNSGSGLPPLEGILINWLLSLIASNLFLHILIILEKLLLKIKFALQNQVGL